MSLPFDLDHVRAHPTMYLVRVEFDTIAAYIQGLDAATHYSLLVGFHEWLVPKCDWGPNLAWTELILALAFPGVDDSRRQLQQPDDHAKAIECLFANLDAFWAERSTPEGMRAIYLRFHAWLKRQEWYTPAMPDWMDDEGNQGVGA